MQSITVFAAASLADVVPNLADAWQPNSPTVRIRTSLGASGVIARQIEAGAGADLFISANHKWINYLTATGRSAGNSRVVALNQLALVLPCRTASTTDLSNPINLGQLLVSNRFAMADPSVSPAGDYTKTALERMALWDTVKKNATYAGSARLALLLSERGGLPSFVYTTDAQKSSLVCIGAKLPTDSYPAIEYVGMLPAKANGEVNKLAEAFLNWLSGPTAAAIWRKHGFAPTVPK